MPRYTKPKRIWLKAHPEFSEKWVQEIIAADPEILGLGSLFVKDKERAQTRAGRLDLLLQDTDLPRRFEVELQLGATDESHIIRTLEYWDIERKRYPQYEHCAVIVAEDITSRFFNVISLFNGFIPIVAIQMQALQVGDHVTLNFTKVLDQFELGLVDEDEEAESAPADRAYWETDKGSKATVKMADALLVFAREKDDELELKYNQHYIGIAKGGVANNFVSFVPKRKFMIFQPKLPRTDEVDALIEEAELDALEYSSRWRHYRIRVRPEEVGSQSDVLRELVHRAYQHRIE